MLESQRANPLERIACHSFLPDLLPDDAIVLDVGANRGSFAKQIVAAYPYQCFCVEPNPEMFDLIPSGKGITKCNFAVSNNEGSMEFFVSVNPEMSSLNPSGDKSEFKKLQVQSVTLESLMKRLNLQRIDLLKLDIEGAEIDLLLNAPESVLTGIRQIAVEFHESHGQGTIREIRQVARRLKQLGFAKAKMSLRHHGDVLFINRKLCGLKSWDVARLLLLERNKMWIQLAWQEYRGRRALLQD